MSIKDITLNLNIIPDKETIKYLKKQTKEFIELLKRETIRQKINADVFLGGSFAKNTLVKKEKQDIDIFVRFDWEYEELSSKLEKIVKDALKGKKFRITKIHGSRDYFRVEKNNIIFEVIPVLKIRHPREARNVTDLSYFHVNYVKNKINDKLSKEIALAKTFCRAQGAYGAESYIQGFSGYGLECLILYYKSFEKMLRELAKVEGDRLIIDLKRYYKNKDEVLFQINESKLKSPVILVDPTWKERNVLASLSWRAFRKFQEAIRKFLKNPRKEFFEEKKIDINKLINKAKKSKSEFLHLMIQTDKQAGDIAGTKLKKFAKFLIEEISRYFEVLQEEFEYNEKQTANVYLILKSKGEIIKIGPPLKMTKNALAFKKANKNVFVKNELYHARINVDFNASGFLKDWMKKNARKIGEMDIIEMKIKN